MKSKEKETVKENSKTNEVKGKKENSKESPKKSNIFNNLMNKPLNLDAFPKNVNEFRHIMDDVNCCRADIEFMLELRRHKNIKKLDRSAAFNEPHFYQDDLIKYRNRITKKFDEKKLLQTNIGIFKHLFGDRTKYAINDSLYKYEVTLRTEPIQQLSKSLGKVVIKSGEGENKKNTNVKKIIPWNSTNIPKEKSLFDTLLPPILGRSKEILSKFDNKIGRPIIQIRKDGFINGERIKSRIFEYNNALARRYPSEHYPSSRYSNDYGVQNIGTIRHLLDSDNRTMTSYWSTYLRGDKKRKYSPEETKQREKKLKEKTEAKVFNKS